MKTIKDKIRILLITIFSFFVIISSGQQELDECKKNSADSNYATTTVEQNADMVINTKMIERFYEVYDEIEVLPFNDLISNNNFEDAVLSLNIYRSLDLNKIEQGGILEALDAEKSRVREYMSEEIFKVHPIASVEDENTENNKF